MSEMNNNPQNNANIPQNAAANMPPVNQPPVEPETKKKGRKKKKKEDEYTNPNNRKFIISTIVILVIVAIILAFMATFCFVGNTWFAKTDIGDPETVVTTYSEEDRAQAAEAVVKFFHKNQAGSILLEVTFSENFSERTGMLSFEGRFYSMFSNVRSIKDSVPGTIYKNWHWDLEKNPDTGEYEVVQYGVLKDMTIVGQEDVEVTEAPVE